MSLAAAGGSLPASAPTVEPLGSRVPAGRSQVDANSMEDAQLLGTITNELFQCQLEDCSALPDGREESEHVQARHVTNLRQMHQGKDSTLLLKTGNLNYKEITKHIINPQYSTGSDKTAVLAQIGYALTNRILYKNSPPRSDDDDKKAEERATRLERASRSVLVLSAANAAGQEIDVAVSECSTSLEFGVSPNATFAASVAAAGRVSSIAGTRLDCTSKQLACSLLCPRVSLATN